MDFYYAISCTYSLKYDFIILDFSYFKLRSDKRHFTHIRVYRYYLLWKVSTVNSNKFVFQALH